MRTTAASLAIALCFWSAPLAAAPVFETDPVEVVAGSPDYGYGVVATEASGADVTITAPTLPAWLSFSTTPQWVVSTFSGGILGVGYADGAAQTAQFRNMYGIVVGPGGDLYVADTHNHRIRRVDIDSGAVTTVAGSGARAGDDGVGEAASFFFPQGIDADDSYLYVADAFNDTIRQIEVATGEVTTIAGQTGVIGLVDGDWDEALFNRPKGIAIDADGNLYVSDTDNNVIRRVDGGDGSVTTLAGSSVGEGGFIDRIGGDARFSLPRGLTWVADSGEGAGRLLIADSGNHAIRSLDLDTLVVTTVAGTGSAGDSDGPAESATFAFPFDVERADDGTLYVVDSSNHRIRRVAAGQVTTLAGDGTPGYREGLSTRAQFQFPRAIALGRGDAEGYLFISDRSNGAIRRMELATATLIGTATSAELGEHEVVLRALSTEGSTDQSFTIDVQALNARPVISGSPPTVVDEGQMYDFTPTASDADGDDLRFRIVGRPSWATFEPATGRLFGTPGYEDAGLNLLVAIVVDDGTGLDNSSAILQPYNLLVRDAEPSPGDMGVDMDAGGADMAADADLGADVAADGGDLGSPDATGSDLGDDTGVADSGGSDGSADVEVGDDLGDDTSRPDLGGDLGLDEGTTPSAPAPRDDDGCSVSGRRAPSWLLLAAMLAIARPLWPSRRRSR